MVDPFEMETQVDALAVGLATNRALVRTLPRVSLLVRLEMSELRVGIVADWTDIGLLTSMSPHVHCQCILVDERLRHTSTTLMSVPHYPNK